MADSDPIIKRHTPGFRRNGERITIRVSVTSCRALREAFLDALNMRERFVEGVITWPDTDGRVLFLDHGRFQTKPLVMSTNPHRFFVRQDKEGVDWISGVGDDARAALLLVRSASAA